jgi:hypothetical protein
VTTICFTRQLYAPTATVSPHLSTSQPLTMIYAAAANGVTQFGYPHPVRGAFTLDLTSGQSQQIAVFSRKNEMNIHGALMSVAWALLLPQGTLMARHK